MHCTLVEAMIKTDPIAMPLPQEDPDRRLPPPEEGADLAAMPEAEDRWAHMPCTD